MVNAIILVGDLLTQTQFPISQAAVKLYIRSIQHDSSARSDFVNAPQPELVTLRTIKNCHLPQIA